MAQWTRLPGAARIPVRGLAVTGVLVLLLFGVNTASFTLASASASPRINHVFVIMEENNGFSDVIGNPAAPNLNAYAEQFGVATEYFGVSPASSESNYVGLLGGSVSGVNSDDAYWTQLVHGPSLITQLDRAGISWKAYLQSLPYPGYEGICYPIRCNGAPDSDPLYVSKHDGIQNFTDDLNPYDWSHQVPVQELTTDLRTGDVPRFSYIVPDECHDMHGDPPYCLDSGNIGDPQNQRLVAVGDAYLGQLVSDITDAPFWAQGNNAIAITYDNGDTNEGCCDGRPGGGQVATIVITSHGPRGLRYPNPSNHYSLLSSIEQVFGLGCLRFTCDRSNVQPMTPLFAVTGSSAIATNPVAVPFYPTPTPTLTEPTSMTAETPTAGGWTVQRAMRLGSSDNNLGAVAGSSPTDVWAVGNYLPSDPGSNPDATLTLAEHYNGKDWTVVPTPDAGPNFNSFYGLAAMDGQAWAVGERLNAAYQDRALLEHWDGATWSIVNLPQPGSVRDMLFGAAALSPSDVWVVGDQEGADNRFETLAEHWNGSRWTLIPTPDPGSSGNHLYAVSAIAPDDVWAVGQQLGSQAPDQALIEHWNGATWSVVRSPTETTGSTMLDDVAAANGQVWAVGEHDSAASGGLPLVEHYQGGTWRVVSLPAAAEQRWTDLYGVTVSGNTVWADGTYVNMRTQNNEALVLRGVGDTWSVDRGPQPGTGSNILGGITSVKGQLWAAGVYDNGGSELPFVERR